MVVLFDPTRSGKSANPEDMHPLECFGHAATGGASAWVVACDGLISGNTVNVVKNNKRPVKWQK